MIDYEALRVIWWALLAVLLIGFAITDGFDLGVGALFRFIGRNDEERRTLLAAIEPVWEGNQVWFILGGGAVFAAWPLLYATSFSGLYPAMLLLLLSLILRPVGFGFRNLVGDARWRNAWDWALCLGGAVPALLFGVAVGNLFLGLPFHFDSLQRPLYTGGFFALLSPLPLLIGVVSLSMLLLQGASYAALKTNPPIAGRASKAGIAAAVAFVLAFVLAGVLTIFWTRGYRIMSAVDAVGPSNPMLKTVLRLQGSWFDNFRDWPLLWVAPLTATSAALLAGWLLASRRPGAAFIASSMVQAATILTAGFALFPFLMPSSTNPDQSLTVWDASSSARTLTIMLVAVIVFLPFVLAYTTWVFRVLKGRISLATLREHEPH